MFIIVLIIILAFILGVRYGQKVENNNKIVNYILSITPTQVPPTPIPPTPPIYKEYKSKKWGLTFTYPDNLEVKESSKTAEVLFEIKK